MLIEDLHASLDDLRLQKWAEMLQQQIETLQRVWQRLEGAVASP
jgi:hypothetical protein